MDGLVPGEALEAPIGPSYPKPGRAGRPHPLRTLLLRVHWVQLRYDLSEQGMEENGLGEGPLDAIHAHRRTRDTSSGRFPRNETTIISILMK